MGYKDPERQREYQRKWIAARRAEFFTGKSCVDCGATNSLELDHVDASTKISHSVWSWSATRREEELAKCVVRCTACHLIKSITHDFKQPRHGTRTMYERHGCKCEPCKEAKRVHNRQRYLPG